MILKKIIKSVIIFSISLYAATGTAAQSSQQIPYYGEEFYRSLSAGESNEDLAYAIKAVLRSYHVAQANTSDLLVDSCTGQRNCYAHTSIGYDAARVFLMGNYYLVKDGNGYGVQDVYCDKTRSAADFPGKGPAPNTVPDNTVINVEHTWPQSHFTRKFRGEMQKSDLHHLFPTDSQINAIRGNNMFGEVVKDLKQLKCPASRYGIGTGGNKQVFEPPNDHKGNVARALFYFSMRYDVGISHLEEGILRKWNNEDPVDDEEIRRNHEIFKVQGNRNPFVDFPDLAERIADF